MQSAACKNTILSYSKHQILIFNSKRFSRKQNVSPDHVFLRETCFFPSTLYFIFTYKGKITKNCRKIEKKAAKLQFTKVIENYNLKYLCPLS